MTGNNSDYPGDWFRIGDKEFRRAEILLDFDDLEGSGFNIQQAIEKYFKGFLLSKGWKLKRIHDLEILLNEIVVYEQSFEEFRETCQKITNYYIDDRYPIIVSSELTKNEVVESLNVTKMIIQKVRQIVNQDKPL